MTESPIKTPEVENESGRQPADYHTNDQSQAAAALARLLAEVVEGRQELASFDLLVQTRQVAPKDGFKRQESSRLVTLFLQPPQPNAPPS